MTIALPTSIAPASQWQFLDWRKIKARSAAATILGTATITLDPVPDGELWLLDRAVVSCTGAAGSLARLYENTTNPHDLIDGTDTGRFDVAEWPNGLLLTTGTALVVMWTSCDVGAVGTFRAQARVYKRR